MSGVIDNSEGANVNRQRYDYETNPDYGDINVLAGRLMAYRNRKSNVNVIDHQKRVGLRAQKDDDVELYECYLCGSKFPHKDQFRRSEYLLFIDPDNHDHFHVCRFCRPEVRRILKAIQLQKIHGLITPDLEKINAEHAKTTYMYLHDGKNVEKDATAKDLLTIPKLQLPERLLRRIQGHKDVLPSKEETELHTILRDEAENKNKKILSDIRKKQSQNRERKKGKPIG